TGGPRLGVTRKAERIGLKRRNTGVSGRGHINATRPTGRDGTGRSEPGQAGALLYVTLRCQLVVGVEDDELAVALGHPPTHRDPSARLDPDDAPAPEPHQGDRAGAVVQLRLQRGLLRPRAVGHGAQPAGEGDELAAGTVARQPVPGPGRLPAQQLRVPLLLGLRQPAYQAAQRRLVVAAPGPGRSTGRHGYLPPGDGRLCGTSPARPRSSPVNASRTGRASGPRPPPRPSGRAVSCGAVDGSSAAGPWKSARTSHRGPSTPARRSSANPSRTGPRARSSGPNSPTASSTSARWASREARSSARTSSQIGSVRGAAKATRCSADRPSSRIARRTEPSAAASTRSCTPASAGIFRLPRSHRRTPGGAWEAS